MRLMGMIMEEMVQEQGIMVGINKAIDNILPRLGVFEGMNLTMFLKL